MALFNKRELLASAVRNRAYTFSNEAVQASAKDALKAVGRSFNSYKTYDIFLSHSYEDRALIDAVRESLTNIGHTVYVDWIDDHELDRETVTKGTVNLLRDRMKACRCLFYATSVNARKSTWMPWELGYFDGQKGRVAVLPIVDTPDSTFTGQEYLSVYPYVDKTMTTLFIHADPGRYVTFSRWLDGANP